jgi:hypothetical protein
MPAIAPFTPPSSPPRIIPTPASVPILVASPLMPSPSIVSTTAARSL